MAGRTRSSSSRRARQGINMSSAGRSAPRDPQRRRKSKKRRRSGSNSRRSTKTRGKDRSSKTMSLEKRESESKSSKSQKKTNTTSNYALINGENKSDAYNLRADVQVKRKGGLILSWTGTRVEVPAGAVGSSRARVMSAPLPAAVRAYACPWLGPNLRLGSEVHLFWSPLRLRKPLRCFVPFSPAAALELTTAEADRAAREAYAEKVKATREAIKNNAKRVADSLNTEETHRPDASADKKKDKKKNARHERGKVVDYMSFNEPLLDTRSVFVLQAKIGDDFWTLKKDVEIIQPTIHNIEWPSRMLEAAFSAGRFSEHNRLKGSSNAAATNQPTATPASSQRNASLDSGVSTNPGSGSPAQAAGRGRRGAGPRQGSANSAPSGTPADASDVESQMRAARDAIAPLEVAKRAATFTGGVAFEADELCDFIVVVIGTPSETVTFDSAGGLLRAPIIHPLFSVRVPKLALGIPVTSTFKAVQVNKDLMEAIHHFDNQLLDINECSNIYELDLGTEPFDRPITVTLPLPKWYTQMVERMQSKAPVRVNSGADATEAGTGVGTSDAGETKQEGGEGEVTSTPKAAASTGVAESQKGDKKSSHVSGEQSNANNQIPLEKRPKNLVLLYQRPLMKRQLVWRVCSGDGNSDNLTNRKRQTKTGPYRDTLVSPLLRGDSLNAKNGWVHLLLGLKGAPWKDVLINGPFTPRCININTYQLGRFAMVYSGEPTRNPPSKVAHLMARLEALSVAPPGVLLPCLLSDANRGLSLWIDCVPSSRLIPVLEERLVAGYMPLVQSTASPSRRCAAVANCAYQSLQYLLNSGENQSEKTNSQIPVFGTSKFRISGFDLLRVLLYNGLCIRVVVKGSVQIKTRGLFDCLPNLLEAKKNLAISTESQSGEQPAPNTSPVTVASTTTGMDTSALFTGGRVQPRASQRHDLIGPDQFITAMETRFSYHDLLSDTATVVDLEPLKEGFAHAAAQRVRKQKIIEALMKRRLEELEANAATANSEATSGVTGSGGNNSLNHNVHNSFNDDADDYDLSPSTHSTPATLPPLRLYAESGNEAESDAEQEANNNLNSDAHNAAADDWDEDGEVSNDGGGVVLPPVEADGDDEKTTKETFQALLEAFEAKTASMLGFNVTRDLCRRLVTLYDKGLAADALEFINYVYDLYVVGKVEIYLVQPTELSQLRERGRGGGGGGGGGADSAEDFGPEANLLGGGGGGTTNSSNRRGRVAPLSRDEERDDVTAVLEVEEVNNNDEDEEGVAGMNQSNMRWNKKTDLAGGGGESPNQPLASFDLLIDPDMYMRWAPKSKKMGKP